MVWIPIQDYNTLRYDILQSDTNQANCDTLKMECDSLISSLTKSNHIKDSIITNLKHKSELKDTIIKNNEKIIGIMEVPSKKLKKQFIIGVLVGIAVETFILAEVIIFRKL